MTIKSEKRQIEAINPALGTGIGVVQLPDNAELVQIVADLRAAANIWDNRPKSQRNQALKTLQHEIVNAVDEIATVINRQCGRSYQEGLLEVMTIAAMFGRVNKGKQSSQYSGGVIGVAAGTTFPFLLALRQAIIALAAGNCVVIVIDSQVSKIAALLQKLFVQAGQIAPFVRVVVADKQVVQELIAAGVGQWQVEPDAPLGRVVEKSFGRTNPHPTFAVSFVDSSDLLPNIVRHVYWNAGQGSQRIRVVGVPDELLAQAKTMLAEQMEALTFGYSDQKKDLHHYGALQSVDSAENYSTWLATAQAAGATLLSGGTRDRQFVQPALLFAPDLSAIDTTTMPQAPILIVCEFSHLQKQLTLLYQQHQALYIFSPLTKAGTIIEQIGRVHLSHFSFNDALLQMSWSAAPSAPAKQRFFSDTLAFVQKEYHIPTMTNLLLTPLATTPGNYRALSAALKAAYGATARQRLDSAEIVYNSYKVQQSIAQVSGRVQEIIEFGKQKLGKLE